MILKLSFTNHLRVLSFHIMGTILMLVTLYFLNFNQDYLIIFLICWSIYTLPVLYLHIEYYLKNKGEEIEIVSNRITIIKNGNERSYSVSELSKIVVYKSASLDKWGIPLSAMEFYHYARIYTKNGEEIIITCLLVPNVDETVRQLRGVSYERKKRIAFLEWK